MMTKKQWVVAGVGAALVGAALSTNLFVKDPKLDSVVVASPSPSATAMLRCHATSNDSLTVRPDKVCTPGAYNPSVTQATIKTTICVRGWTNTIRPALAYTSALKIEQMKAYGFSPADIHSYEEDHFIPLALGGSPTDPKNLWPEFGAAPNPKDKVESLLHYRVCSGKITLSKAQKAIAADWTTALAVK